MSAEHIRVRGLVQGVGFRPHVWHLAQTQGLAGWVCNDAEGVLIEVWGGPEALQVFAQALEQEAPPLARIDCIERNRIGHDDLSGATPPAGFSIRPSHSGEVHTGVIADAATCAACAAEIRDPANRRYRYPFTNCTHCGPRLSIVRRIPYDRANTSMAGFPLCPACRAEYEDPADRRFHAQPNACPQCGPRVWLQAGLAQPELQEGEDAIACASRLLAAGWILAIKGIGGFHLACDAANPEVIDRLRQRKRRQGKPFALMARDLEVIRRYVQCSPAEAGMLSSAAAPVLLLAAGGPEHLPDQLAPGQTNLGFMLAYSPLHQLLLADWERPLVMTSANLSEEPQCIANAEALDRLKDLADAFVLHDRPILNRVDDSVMRVIAGQPRLLRRARGFAPAPLNLPPGFAALPPVLAMGGELKNTFCLLKDGQAILCQHLGDLHEAHTAEEYRRTLELYLQLYQHQPQRIAIDLHPDYQSSRQGEALAAGDNLPLIRVQHHFAHIASVLADNAWPLDGPKVLGLALDGLGLGDDGSIWGAEFLLADYRGYRRLARLKPARLPGGNQAMREPWRNTLAHLVEHLGWARVCADFPDLEPIQWLQQQPIALLLNMLDRGLNSPLSSSCGRLFDAVAGVLDICRSGISFEGEAAMALEALAREDITDAELGRSGPEADHQQPNYPFALTPDSDSGLIELDPAPMWLQLLQDLQRGEAPARIAARFHLGLADALCELARQLAASQGLNSIALSGGVMQNKTLFEVLVQRLEAAGLRVLSQQQVPANDGGLALGQAVIAAAHP
ncbi:carbamoyltransferase HypF [Magnetovirga frankeli]|uniref:carbamoyltransferase HypF n=1 Tax=Magnetovirga frankeli TaxID=947516 RepID=UPI001293EEC7|nr:carbamoyltransferase HypF [gamma proteobacterium SS-5]